MIRLIQIVIFWGVSTVLFSQDPSYLELVKAESDLQQLFNLIYSDTIIDQEPVLEEILQRMSAALELEGAMEYPWHGLERIGVITSDDRRLRVFTWHLEVDPDSFRYFGFMQLAMRRDRIRVVDLVDNGKNQREVFNLDQSTGDWYGKLYYGIITTGNRRQTLYTLLGMDFNNNLTTVKTVEVLEIQRNRPRFLHERFFNGKDLVDRLVLEYSSQVAISVRWDPDISMITFDHLVPFHPVYSGNYEFYGPDGSYDGLEFSEGVWIYRQDIDARNRD